MTKSIAIVLLSLLPLLLACQRQQPSKRYSRQDFERLVMHQTQQEVLKRIGKPNSTGGGYIDTWTYERITYDPVNQQIDGTASISFIAKSDNPVKIASAVTFMP